MKKMRNIALGLVAAMTTATLVATPASAAVMSVATTLDGASKTATSATAPVALPVPEDNKIDAADALKFVATVDTGTSVSVSATNATIVTALYDAAAPVTATSGSSSLTVATGTGTTATFYVYTKTTAIGTITVTNQGTTQTYYVQGTAGKVNTLTLTSVDAGTTSSVVTATAAAFDVFNNKVPSIGLTALVVGGTLDTTTATTASTLTGYGAADFKVTLPATGQSTLVVRLTNDASGAATVVGFNTPVTSAVKTITVRDLLGELAAEKAGRAADKTTADAAIAKLTADLATANASIAKLNADAITAKAAADKALADAKAAADKALADALAKAKADNDAALKSIKDAFNALATKWNAKNPKSKVTLIK